MNREVLEGVASASTTTVSGIFQRHTSPRVRDLVGSSAGGRWGPRRAYSVLSLGRPIESIAGEAYRHLVDAVLDGQLTGDMVGPRNVVTCSVVWARVLDLRDPGNRVKVGLSMDDLTTDVGDYARCQNIGRAAHQLELGGVIAPAATGLGETLAIFERHKRQADRLVVLSVETWVTLPADPRSLTSESPT